MINELVLDAAISFTAKVFEKLQDDTSASLIDRAKEWLGGKKSDFDWRKAAAEYLSRLADEHGTMRVLGKPKPISLEGVFTDVFISDQINALKRFDITQLRSDPALLNHDKRMNGMRLVTSKDAHRLFILGKPGAGKTTFLRYITVQAVQGKLKKIPIFIILKRWSDSGLELFDFIVKEFEICAFPDAQNYLKRLLERGEAIILFDGLDEVNQEIRQGEQLIPWRTKLIQTIQNFSRQYHACQCLITCRIAASDFSFDKFTYVELADFDEGQINSFVGKWFKGNPTKHDLFLAELKQHANLRDLARVPLLLTMLCLAFEETMQFPQRRVEIYEEAIDALLKKWDSSRDIRRDEVYHKLSLGYKRQLFQGLAYETFSNGDYFMPQAAVVKRLVAFVRRIPPADKQADIDGEAILKAIEAQHGILVERAHHIYSFAHLSFQEYFAAKYIYAQPHLFPELLREHAADSRWRETFLMVASLLDDPTAFFETFLTVLHNMVTAEPELVKLFQWADRKAATVQTKNFTTVSLRSYYLTYGFTHTLARNYVYNIARMLAQTLVDDIIFVHDTARDLILTRDTAFTFAISIERDFNLVRNLAYAQEIDIYIDESMDLIYLYALASAESRDQYIAFEIQPIINKWWLELLKNVQTWGLTKLEQTLNLLIIPTTNDSQTTWKNFSVQLQKIMKQRDIVAEWSLNSKQKAFLANYLQATQLLVDCLAVAHVDDREAIESRLLRV